MKLKAVSVIVLILFLAIMLSMWMSPIAAQPTGMVSYWRLNEGSGTTAYDSVGANDGALLPAGPTWTTGIVDGALSFDGVDDYVEMSGITMGSAFSVEAWAYLDVSDSQPNAEIVSQSNDLERVFNLRRDDTNAWRFDLYTGGANNPLISSTNFNTGWHFVVGTWNGSHMKLYVDSSETASAPLSSADSIPNVPIRINTGINLAQQIRYWKHEIDEVAIYNRALPLEEIQQHYQNGLLGLGYYSELTVTSSPLTGIHFTINGTQETTPYTEWLLEGHYTLEMPQTHNGYVFSQWLEDGDPNRIKTILLQGTTWTAVYEPAPPPPVGGKATPINIGFEPELQTPWLLLTTIILPLLATIVYVKLRKKKQ